MDQSSRFLRAFNSKRDDTEVVARAAGNAIEGTGHPYLIIVDDGGVIRHFAGPEGPPVLALLETLTRQHFLEEVAAQIRELEEERGEVNK